MATHCKFLNPLQRDGTSQRQRFVPALNPAYVSVDERKLPDLLNYARRYAKLLRYYTPTNSFGGDWVEFIEHDISVLVSMIGATDTDAVRKQFEEKHDAFSAAAAPEKAQAYGEMFSPVFGLAETFDRWYRGSIEGLALRSTLRRLIGSVLTDALREALSQSRRAESLDIPVEPADTAKFAEVWVLSDVIPDPSLFPSEDISSEEEMADAVKRLSALFERFFEAVVFVVRNAGGGDTGEGASSYLQETLYSHPEHQPHMALFLAFLKIFAYAQRHLNTLTAAHLDFYYEKVLGLKQRAEKPDRAHVVFELAKKNFATHKLSQNTRLTAGKDPTGVELIYATDSELVVNRAVLDEDHGLKTVFVDQDEASGVVNNIYAAPDADSADGKGAEIEDEDGKWSTFGGTHMPYARIGFAVASPMFLLGEGARTVTLTFYVSSVDFLTGETADVELELKHNIKVEASGQKEWLTVSIENVDVCHGSTSCEDSAHYVRFELELEAGLGPVVRYDKKVLEGGYDTKLPVFRFLLDNEGFAAGTEDHDYSDESQSYESGDLVLYMGRVYRARSEIDQPGLRPDSHPEYWDAIEPVDYDDATQSYLRGTLVRYGGEVYKARRDINSVGLRPVNHTDLWQVVEYSYPYRYFERMDVRRVDIALDVDNVKNLVLESDVGLLDPAKPFYPFGPVPRVGSRFLVGSHEAFQKSLTKVELRFVWADLPSESFFEYYNEYDPSSSTSSGVSGNQHFKATLQVLQDGAWLPSESPTKKSLFDHVDESADADESASEDPLPPPAPDKTLSTDGEFGTFERDPELAPFTRFDTALRQGFLTLDLQTSFLHREYPVVLAKAAPTGTNIPNPPYTPLIASLSLDYEATQAVDFAAMDKDDFAKRVEQVFQIGPFGQREIFPIAEDPTATDVPIARKLVPEFTATVKAADGSTSKQTAQGTLYIGVDELEPPQNLSILFQVAEGSEDPLAQQTDLLWSYLAGGEWKDFSASELIADGTNGLLRSGVVKLAMPKAMTTQSTLLPGGLHWIKASVIKDSNAVPKLIAVQPQAVAVSFRNQGNDPQHLSMPFPAGKISKLKTRTAAIKSVTQPYASFGGRMREADQSFYVRVSERLRHKGRAVTIFDYERLVLEKFPEVYKVKCINHTSNDSEYAPGDVKLLVVPNLRNQNAVDPHQPRLSRNKLEEIQSYLAKLASGFVRILVANPTYEEVRVRLAVRFHKGRDKGLYTTKLEQDIIEFLSPWLHDDAADLVFGGRIHRSSILNYVEEREYVDFVTEFEMDHVLRHVVWSNVEEAVATSSSAALVATKDHQINPDVTSCEDTVRRRKTCLPPGEQVDTLAGKRGEHLEI